MKNYQRIICDSNAVGIFLDTCATKERPRFKADFILGSHRHIQPTTFNTTVGKTAIFAKALQHIQSWTMKE